MQRNSHPLSHLKMNNTLLKRASKTVSPEACRSASPVILVCLSGIEEAKFMPSDIKESLSALSGNVVWCAPPASSEALVALLSEVQPEILLCAWSLPLLPADRAAFPSLRYICYLAGSVQGKIPRALIRQGLAVTNWGPSISPVVAECALMLVLMCLREAGFWALAMHAQGGWKSAEYMGGRSLIGRKVGLYGIGAIARAFIPLLKPYGCSVCAYSRDAPATIFAAEGVARVDTLDELFASCDIVVVVEASTPANRYSVRESHLRKLGSGVFVNIARGQLVDEDALVLVASEGELRVGLDVYQEEPLPKGHPLRGMPNVCLLPHIAGPTADRCRDSGALAARNIRNFLQGEPLAGNITLERYDWIT